MVCCAIGMYGHPSGGRFPGPVAWAAMSSEEGERLPLYLSGLEAQVLALAVEMCLRLDSSVLLNEQAQQMAEEVIRAREGESGVARADQALAAARERLPVLRRLREAIGEIGARLSEGGA